MSLSKVFDIAGAGMTAQSMRLNVVSSNIANVDSAVSSNGDPYKGKKVVFTAIPINKETPQVATVRVTAAPASATTAAVGTSAEVLTDGRIWFEMKMPMGDHRYTLVAGQDGWYDAEVVLPFCPSGNPRWYANVEGTVDGRRIATRFRLDLTKP